MRDGISIVLLLLTAALTVCAYISGHSPKAIGRSVNHLLCSIILPVVGNLIIIVSRTQSLTTVGCYFYYVGIDVVVLFLLQFMLDYCQESWPRRWLKDLVYLLVTLDILQLLLNPILGHAFTTELVMVEGEPYYKLVPYLWQNIHRALVYAIFISVVVVFFIKMVRSSRVYYERYFVIFISMLLIGIWDSFYVFSGSPIDLSMMGYGVFGLLVFYFSLYYRPMRLLDRMLAEVASEMPQALFFFDDGARCVWANEQGCTLTGVSEDNFERCSGRLAEIFGDIDLASDEWACTRELGEGDGARFYRMEKQRVTDPRGRRLGSFLSVLDDTEQHRELLRETYAATHDSLTGLYNREYLYKRIRETLDANPDTEYLLCYIDINDFKVINDVFGTDFGDYTLCHIADSLRATMKPEHIYGRLGGDTFGIFMPASTFDADIAEHCMADIVVNRDTLSHRLMMHAGIYRIVNPNMDVSMMFDRAHMAQETIEDDFMKHIAFYDDAMRESVLWEQRISSELSDALAQRQIRAYLQALVDTSGKIIGAEALVRWIHPTDGMLSPARFVPVLEKNGMIADVDKYMWRSACEVLARWHDMGRDDLFISVNISPKDFYFMDVVEELKSIVREYGVDPARMRLEITETVMMTDNENRIQILCELQAAGFIVEMDDFGSGYSSLNMLKDMPVDVIKIDMMFLRRAGDDVRSQIILQSIVKLVRELGIHSLTEGVETKEQYDMLTEMGCELFQGYYFAKPMPVEEFEALLSEQDSKESH